MNTKKYGKILSENLFSNNPVFVQILGICSTLAVTNNFINTLVMASGVTLSTAFSNFTISAIKDLIPRKVRMIVQVLIISFYVIIFDLFLKAFVPQVSKVLGPYVGLIITNCILMGRAEAFAQANPPLLSFWDGISSGLGYMYVLCTIAFVRELLGFGTILNIRVMPDSFLPWTIMVMAPSAFFILGIFIWIVKGPLLQKGGNRK
ncbi:MAG TPA: NADH:ubiquinone reductase (Na(+)-transporting) subunit D [Petrotogaceae bacterium]|jgi:Na+-transporting NADH:ubiquinone oxidoreductase subunit D|nr:NADH:ubiquinone reductase (Na(+)-transporting) subunit D [Petrotogaceae bacterium]HPA92497.1 NADH:ubiquinone reductase (Na(+)-transporting) subunit D [Petrotogaceae bacterium]HPX15690.1 NADH:ubiquinone reductase (Na(+)-transporting) subunit D [Petrotogaceae bacterium]HQC39730.1 NADH:ubiquinone reductase (Na(+)-transporting) subunit D [Petrotogaceae bacterium]HQF33203.1 NADH:ubiquinone reductase (Na(+)-transporting) subunit D [Petrotogaceae bacterium]